MIHILQLLILLLKACRRLLYLVHQMEGINLIVSVKCERYEGGAED